MIEKKCFQRIIAVMMAAIMVLALAACGGTTSTKPEETGSGTKETAAPTGVKNASEVEKEEAPGISDETLTVAIGSEPTSLDPHACGAYGGVVDNCLYENLIFYNSLTGEYEPWLAESWEVIDDTTYRYHLRRDVTAVDGTGLTASDVLFTFKRGIENPESNTEYAIYDVDNFNIVDEYTIDIKTTAPNANAFINLANTTFAIIDESSTEAVGGADAVVTNPMSGTGPYKFVEWETGQYIKLERNDNYWGEAPYYKEIIVRFIADETTRSLSLESGDVDVITGVSAAQTDTLVSNSDIQVFSQTSKNAIVLCMNTKRALLDDVNVRKAIAYAINKEAIVSVFCEGFGTVLDTVVSPANPLYVDLGDDFKYEYNPEKAKECLKEAGYENGLDISLLYYDANQLVAEVLQNNLAAVGIRLELNCSEVWSDINSTGDFDMLLCTFFGRTNTQIFGLMDNRIDYNGRNHDAYGDDSLNSDLDTLYGATDPSSVLDVSQKLLEQFQKDIPTVGLISTDYLYASRSNLTGFYTSTGLDQLLLYKIRPVS